jgi:hypothetical protein
MKTEVLESREAKKKFFSMDIAERLIRVEQVVSASFNRPLAYNQTECYKGMTNNEKIEFEEFIRNRKKLFFLLLFFYLYLDYF